MDKDKERQHREAMKKADQQLEATNRVADGIEEFNDKFDTVD